MTLKDAIEYADKNGRKMVRRLKRDPFNKKLHCAILRDERYAIKDVVEVLAEEHLLMYTVPLDVVKAKVEDHSWKCTGGHYN